MTDDFHADTCSQIEDIENREQSILQHLRTSGLKKVRENSITEEIMELRRCRRRVFRDIISKVCSQDDSLKTQEKDLVDKMNTEIESRVGVLKKELEVKNNELLQLRGRFIAEVEAVKQSESSAAKEKVLEMRTHYESKIQLLEAKFSDINKYRKESQESHVPRETVIKQMEDMKASFDRKLERYQNALNAMTEREMEYQTTIRQVMSSNKQLEKELQDGKATMISREQDMKGIIAKLKDQLQIRDGKIIELEKSLHDYVQVRSRWQNQMDQVKNDVENTSRNLQEKHRLELEMVDEKVRRAMQTKDDLCKTLRQELKDTRQRLVEAESALKHLSQDLRGSR